MSKTTFKIKVNHVPDVQKQFGVEGLYHALELGGIRLRDHAANNVNNTFQRGSGAAGLGGSITVERREYKPGHVSVDVGPKGKIYARIQELGGHIRPIKAKLLSWIDPGTGERRFSKHVYIPPRPYLRPAFDEHKEEIVEVIQQGLINLLKRGLK
jgi:HK97 gp10 family phage protein